MNWDKNRLFERLLGLAFVFFLLHAITIRWKRSKKDPSFENTFTGFGFGGAAFELVDGSDVDEDVAVSGEAYPEAGRDIADIVGVVETESRS
ncbi:hypothetical protein PAXINDRAFT_9517 [Paxillus involutus ATCC 200175]|nr:hypothetical protein PAXINDRAFT_9517 [Paxillus involutus ATCC 200175]